MLRVDVVKVQAGADDVQMVSLNPSGEVEIHVSTLDVEAVDGLIEALQTAKAVSNLKKPAPAPAVSLTVPAK